MATEGGPTDAAEVSHRGNIAEGGPTGATTGTVGAEVSHRGNIADKAWWGPRIWRILHSLAEINDRNDVGPAWRQVLHLTSEILPCAVCREHFRGHVRRVSFPIGVSNYAALRRFLWTAHAGAGASAEPFPEDRLTAEYGGGREEIVIRVTGLVTEVVTAFRGGRVLDALHVVSLNPWHRAMVQLIAMLRYPQPPAAPRRIGGRR
jgi:hypothetical protein